VSDSAYARINPYMYLHFHCSLDEHTVSESAYARINPYMYLHPHMPVSFACTNCWPY